MTFIQKEDGANRMIRWKNGTSKNTDVKESDGVVYLTFRNLEQIPGIVHGFSTRLGGVSKGDCSAMNLGFGRGDEKDCVEENYRRMSKALGVKMEDMVLSHQTHTVNVRVMTEADRGKGVVRPRDYQDVDGMVTNVPDLVLVTMYADCVPLFFVDPVNHAVGLAHSGWKGTVAKIGLHTVEVMKETYGTLPEHLSAVIGPSICQDCYEVSEDVIIQFRDHFESSILEKLFYQKENGKYQLNLWEANRQVLLEAGIPKEQILLPDLCTCCNPQFLFSHRASKGKRGNLGAFLGIRSS